MENLFLSLVSESGVIIALFTMIVLSFIWKGIPAIVKKFDDMQTLHRQESKELHAEFQSNFDKQRTTFETTMDNVVTTFNSQISKSNDWHEKHQNGLAEIKLLISAKNNN